MKILSYNPGHDGSIAYINNGKLIFSIEAEKNSKYRYSPISSYDIFHALNIIEEIPDVVCIGGWWPRDNHEYLNGSDFHSEYRGELKSTIMTDRRRLFGKQVHYFSSSHERSHLLCAFGMSGLSKGTPCYALIWEGAIGAFYEIDAELNISLLGNVLDQVGNRYGQLYGLADPKFSKDQPYFRFEDAGKLMAIASFSNRDQPSVHDINLLEILLKGPYRDLSTYSELRESPYYNVGVEDKAFRNFTGIFSDKIFDLFYEFARTKMTKNLPLVISGGCGLNCDWNTKWRDSGLFSKIFVPPVTNDSGSAIGTAIDAQFHYTKNPKINWDVYSGEEFDTNTPFEVAKYDFYHADNKLIADMLASDLILGWVNGKYEIGPRALGNRSIIAAPFNESTKTRLNNIKQREQFRPIAPVCLEEDAMKWFGCKDTSPYMLYTYTAKTEGLKAVTHVNGSARIQTVSPKNNSALCDLLTAFKVRTGYGVLCNTSLNFNGRGFINNLKDLSAYTIQHHLDGFVINGHCYILKSSGHYIAYMKGKN